MIDILGIVISVLALVVSVIVAIWNYRITQQINKLNMESELYQRIFFDHLISKIPKAQQNIKFASGKVSGTNDLEEELNNLRQDALFFFYHDEEFYKGLCGRLQKLEDTVIKSNERTMDSAKYYMFEKEVKESIDNIYRYIMTKYEGL